MACGKVFIVFDREEKCIHCGSTKEFEILP